jgi:hypothetical protein
VLLAAGGSVAFEGAEQRSTGWPERAAQGTRGAPSQARLLLVTFLGKTGKVTGRATQKRGVEGKRNCANSVGGRIA